MPIKLRDEPAGLSSLIALSPSLGPLNDTTSNLLVITVAVDPHPTRIVIYARVTDIAGCPRRRYVTLGGSLLRKCPGA